MRNKFPGYYRPTEEEIKNLWQNGLIVLDTNVLLDFYRYSEETVNSLLGIIETFKERIFIPFQVALEYHRNINVVIVEQIDSYKEAIKTLENFKDQIEAKRRHPFLTKNLHSEVSEFCQKIDSELKSKQDKIEDLIFKNPTKEKVADLLNNRIGDSFSTTDIHNIIVEGKIRYAKKVPPGYEDSKLKKDDSQYGDLIIWKEIIKKSIAEKKGIIIVTGDIKDDWFLRIRGKTIGPRSELIEEFISQTECAVYIYQTYQFLEYANEHLKTEINKSVLDEVGTKAKEEAENLHKNQSSGQAYSIIINDNIGATDIINTSSLNSSNQQGSTNS